MTGIFYQIQIVPVLVVDSTIAGVYDTIIPDLSTSWTDYVLDDFKPNSKSKYDFDFTDDLYDLIYGDVDAVFFDSDNDGKNDYSAGTFGAQVLDVYGVIKNNSTIIHDSLNAINGTLLPPLDSDGNFFGVMTDFMGHGTSSAASITSRGQESYDIYNNTKKYSIIGVAPDAKILPVKALWLGDTVYVVISSIFPSCQHPHSFQVNQKLILFLIVGGFPIFLYPTHLRVWMFYL